MVDGNAEAYFRGRKLKGRESKVPLGYKGVIVQKAAKKEQVVQNARRMDQECEADNQEEEEEEEEEAREIDEIGSFDRIVLWGHESTVGEDDTFAKGMGEWIAFAESMHKPGQRDMQ